MTGGARSRPRSTASSLAGLLVAAAGCTTAVPGAGTPAAGLRADGTDADVVIHLAEDGDETDRVARNALADAFRRGTTCGLQ